MKIVSIFLGYMSIYLIGLLFVGCICYVFEIKDLVAMTFAGFWGGSVAYNAISKYGVRDGQCD